jgi:hypothetical protein
LVDRVVMNFHPSVLNHAAFVDRLRTIKELYQVVGIVEEKFAVAQERQRLESPSTDIHNSRGVPRPGPAHAASPLKCWNCGGSGHIRQDCPRRVQSSGNRQVPGGQSAPVRRS